MHLAAPLALWDVGIAVAMGVTTAAEGAALVADCRLGAFSIASTGACGVDFAEGAGISCVAAAGKLPQCGYQFFVIWFVQFFDAWRVAWWQTRSARGDGMLARVRSCFGPRNGVPFAFL